MLHKFWFYFHFHGIFAVFRGRQIYKIYVWRATSILSSKRNCVQFTWIVTKGYIAEIIEKFYQSHFYFSFTIYHYHRLMNMTMNFKPGKVIIKSLNPIKISYSTIHTCWSNIILYNIACLLDPDNSHNQLCNFGEEIG
jgi:hypothetical protein